MRGSSALRTSVAPGGALAGPWARNPLWTAARAVPSLDLCFADTKSLVCATTGQNLVSHTRASSGTFVGSDGVLRTAVTNLLLQSEDLLTTWTANDGLSRTANQVVAPNGSTTADLLASNGTLIGYLEQPNASSNQFVNGTTYTYSVYLKKANTSTCFTLLFGTTFNSGGGNPVATWNLDTGIPTFTNGATGSMTAVGNGWYRCVITDTATQTHTQNQQWLRMASASGDVYAWGAQLEQSSTVGEYIPTTSTINSAPRFDHDPQTGESLGLLVEEARTNSIRNNTMVGAVAGTPGTIPTNWTYIVAGTGLTREIVQTGIENGINYIDLRLHGTAASTTAVTVGIDRGAATNGQNWTESAYFKLAAGSASNITSWNFLITEETSGNVFLTGADYPIATPSNTLTRASVTRTLSGGATVAFVFGQIRIFCTNGAAIDFTLRIGLPQLEQGAFATSAIPTTSAAATRAADVASITGSNFGVTRTNLLQRSEEFENAGVWPKSQSSVSSNTATSPVGTLTADSLVENTASGFQHYATQTVTISANTVYTATVYVKANTRSSVRFGFLNSALSSGAFAHFNVSTGVISTQTTAGTASNVSFSIEAAASGWYRCRTTCTVDSSSTLGSVFIGLVDGTNNATYTGDGTSGIYLWGAQLEASSAVTPYIQSPSVFTSRASSGTYVGGDGLIKTATTNEARYDHDPVSLIGKGLLLEDARTNLALDSEDFSAATWTKGAVTVTANAVASPTGATTADSLLETTANTEHLAYATATYTFTTATQSIYVKPNGRTNVALRFYHANDDWVSTVFSLTGNGSVTQSSAGSSSGFSAVSRSITNAGNGWYRISMTATQASRSVYISAPDLCTSSTPTLAAGNGSEVYAGDVTKGVYVWGAQLEAASTASSYIPTTGSTVTRAADISTSVATSVFESSWYRQAEGTFFCSTFASKGIVVYGTGDTFDNTQYVTVSSSNNVIIQSGNADSAVLTAPVSTTGTTNIAHGYAANNFAALSNGGTVSTDTSGAVPLSQVRLKLGSSAWTTGAGNDINGHIKRLTYWPTRLGNEVLQRITQP